MTVVVTGKCIKCKYTDCVDVCPVDCFYEGEVMVVVNPDECIDCGLCEPECPESAIVPDSYEEARQWVDLNRKYATLWPRLREKHAAHSDAPTFKGVADKYPLHFSERPAVSVKKKLETKRKVWGRAASDSVGAASSRENKNYGEETT